MQLYESVRDDVGHQVLRIRARVYVSWAARAGGIRSARCWPPHIDFVFDAGAADADTDAGIPIGVTVHKVHLSNTLRAAHDTPR